MRRNLGNVPGRRAEVRGNFGRWGSFFLFGQCFLFCFCFLFCLFFFFFLFFVYFLIFCGCVSKDLRCFILRLPGLVFSLLSSSSRVVYFTRKQHGRGGQGQQNQILRTSPNGAKRNTLESYFYLESLVRSTLRISAKSQVRQ